MTTPAGLDRAAFDALLQRRVLTITEAAPAPAGDLSGAQAASDARQEAELLEEAARTFADAVDASGRNLSYDNAVVLTGKGGALAITEAEWRDSPAYWETVTAATYGQVETLTQGSVLVRYLRGEPDSPAA